MKGVIFNILEEMVEDNYGMEVWNEILDAADKHEGIFIAGQSYADETIFQFVQIICEKLQQPSEVVVAAFGEYLFTKLVNRHKVLMENQTTLDSFLKSIDSIIHVEVSKLYVDPNLPHIECFDHDSGKMTMRYRSPRKLCPLAEGLIRGASSYFEQPIKIKHETCMHEGSDFCDLEIEYL
ncbi:heme NO-binding domain-containing protein [Marinomonas sp. PE14-40]|uniref:heme NO-binding domain-containing protein n=1 Tax=Marinomonas sp. PE14-40 TaxID=3060621 RepID=UPI003F66886B